MLEHTGYLIDTVTYYQQSSPLILNSGMGKILSMLLAKPPTRRLDKHERL